jgi:hypothetical protein
MKILTTALILLSFSSLTHAGWIIGNDSTENGVLRVSRDINTKVIKLEKCENIKGSCELLDSRSNFSISVSQFFNHIQTGTAALGNVLPAVIGAGIAISPVGWYGAGTVAIEVAGGALVTYGGTKLVTIPKSLNVVRLYDYSSIYFDSFLEDDSSIVAFPEDSLAEIANELL